MQDTEEVLNDKADAQRKVELLRKVNRLLSNPDFIELVTEGYFRDEAVRLVHAKSAQTPEFTRPEMQAKLDTDIKSIGSFANYLGNLERIGLEGQELLDQYAEYEQQNADNDNDEVDL